MVGLPSDIQYCLDNMFELHEITADIYEFYFSVRENAVDWLDGNNMKPETMMEDYNNWRNRAKPEHRATLTLHGVAGLKQSMKDFTMSIANDAINKAGKMPSKKLVESCFNEGVTQERYLRNFDRIYHQTHFDLRSVDMEQVERYRKHIHEEKKHFFLDSHPWSAKDPKKLSYRDRKDIRKRAKKKRKALTKSISLMGRFFSKEDTQLFLGKDTVTITGKNFNFGINAVDFNTNNHGSLKIAVNDKEDNFLTNICFYYEGMPAADQITAFLLDVKSGNENIILKIGNHYNKSALGYTNPILTEVKPKPSIRTDNLDFLDELIPGAGLINQYHDAVMPIASEIVERKLRRRMNSLLKYEPVNKILIGGI